MSVENVFRGHWGIWCARPILGETAPAPDECELDGERLAAHDEATAVRVAASPLSPLSSI